MKHRLYIFFLIGAFLMSVTSCDSFFDTETKQNIPTEDAFNTVQDVQNGLMGAYYAFADYGMYGNYAIAIGDFAADNSVANQSSGHYVSINQYNFSDTDDNLDNLWRDGYRVLDRTTRTIKGAKALLNAGGLSGKEESQLYSFIHQSYALRGMASHVLVCIFGLPYGTDNDVHGGIVIVDKEPVAPNQKVSRSSVVQTYNQILNDIDSSKVYFAKTDEEYDQFYVTEAAVYAFEARVALHMHDYGLAASAAQTAIDLRASGDVSFETYVKMWNSIAITDEDIFTLAKKENDNLSANSLNTLYGSYGGLITNNLVSRFSANDIRLSLIKSNRPLKFTGIPGNEGVNNIPVFRKSEMYLIIAEAKAQQDAVSDAQYALFYTAKRNKDITAATQLPSSVGDLLDFISEERRRELFEEGFRWHDTRRTGEKIMVGNGIHTDFDVSKFVYPIPANEVNAGFGTEQNTGWSSNLPK